MEQKILTITSEDGFMTSLKKALDDIDPNWPTYRGLLMTGTHAPEKINLDWALNQIKKAREEGTPTLGICFGLHLSVIEYARNVLNLPEAMTTEIKKDTITPIINALPGMRVGLAPVLTNLENHWHQYKVNMAYADLLVSHFLMIVSRLPDGERVVEQMQLNGHPFFLLTQYHPEYNSTPEKPHPILVKFIEACKKAT